MIFIIFVSFHASLLKYRFINFFVCLGQYVFRTCLISYSLYGFNLRCSGGRRFLPFFLLSYQLASSFSRSNAPSGVNQMTHRNTKEEERKQDMEFSNIFPHLFAYIRLPSPCHFILYGLSIEIPYRVTEIAVALSFIICVLPTILIKLHASHQCRLSSDGSSCE
jgi:hypothetical protein